MSSPTSATSETSPNQRHRLVDRLEVGRRLREGENVHILHRWILLLRITCRDMSWIHPCLGVLWRLLRHQIHRLRMRMERLIVRARMLLVHRHLSLEQHSMLEYQKTSTENVVELWRILILISMTSMLAVQIPDISPFSMVMQGNRRLNSVAKISIIF